MLQIAPNWFHHKEWRFSKREHPNPTSALSMTCQKSFPGYDQDQETVRPTQAVGQMCADVAAPSSLPSAFLSATKGQGCWTPCSNTMHLRTCQGRSKHLISLSLQSALATTVESKCSQSPVGTASMNSEGYPRLLWVSGLGEVYLEPEDITQHFFFSQKKS